MKRERDDAAAAREREEALRVKSQQQVRADQRPEQFVWNGPNSRISVCGAGSLASDEAGWRESDFFIDNLLVRIRFIIVMIWWTGLAPWEFEFRFPGSLTSTFLAGRRKPGCNSTVNFVACL